MARSVIESKNAPGWLQLPDEAQLEAPSQSKIEVIETAVVSDDDRRDAALIGLLRNGGRSLAGVRIRLLYFESGGRVAAWSVQNEALVSDFPTGAVLPYHFPIAADRSMARNGLLRVSVDEDEVRGRIPVSVRIEEGFDIRGSSRTPVGVAGTARTPRGSCAGSESRATALLTVALKNKEGRILEILAGEARPVSAGVYSFEFRGRLPVAQRVTSLQAWAECGEGLGE